MNYLGAGGAAALTLVALTAPASAAPTETVLYGFMGGKDGSYPQAGLLLDTSGALYGTTYDADGNAACKIGGCGTVFKLSPPAGGGTGWTKTELVSFRMKKHGAYPAAGLIGDASVALYGTTQGGGGLRRGAVFKLTPPAAGTTAWTETVLHSFKGGTDGQYPLAGLLAGANGELYGTTGSGGATNHCANGCGTVFQLTPPATGKKSWTETVICTFQGRTDGAAPAGGLVADASGALYGTTPVGGGSPNCSDYAVGCGIAFKLTPPAAGGTAWTETVIHRFEADNGANPVGALVMDASGALYGATELGGSATNCLDGCGLVFKLAPPAAGGRGWTTTLLHHFTGSEDGQFPEAGLMMDSSGALYGTTQLDMGGFGRGTVFKLTPVAGGASWTKTVLSYLSDGGAQAAASPHSVLIENANGVLYGTTNGGGVAGKGTVYEVAQ